MPDFVHGDPYRIDSRTWPQSLSLEEASAKLHDRLREEQPHERIAGFELIHDFRARRVLGCNVYGWSKRGSFPLAAVTDIRVICRMLSLIGERRPSRRQSVEAEAAEVLADEYVPEGAIQRPPIEFDSEQIAAIKAQQEAVSLLAQRGTSMSDETFDERADRRERQAELDRQNLEDDEKRLAKSLNTRRKNKAAIKQEMLDEMDELDDEEAA